MRSSHHIPCVLFALVLLTGCQPDRDDIYNFEIEEDVGTDVSQRADASVISSQPPEASACTDEGWCWLHPSPFPHDIIEVKAAGDRVFGVADGYELGLRGTQGFVWDGTSMTLVDNPIAPKSEWGDLHATSQGWLGITADGEIYEFTPNDVVGSRDLRNEEYSFVSGLSVDDFVAAGDEGTILYRDGEEVASDLSDLEYEDYMEMWPDGTVWEVDDFPDTRTTVAEGWTVFPRPVGRGVKAMGPSPFSECAEYGIWAAGHDESAGSYRWDPAESSWKEAADVLSGVRDFHCTDDGEFLALRADSVLKRVGSDWEPLELGEDQFDVFGTSDGGLVLGGNLGNWATFGDGTLESHSRKFQFPTVHGDDGKLYTGYMDIWTNESNTQLLILHQGGVFSRKGEVWKRHRRPGFDRDFNWVKDYLVEVWGKERPRFVVGVEALMGLNGDAWYRSFDVYFQENYEWGRPDLAGISADSVWLIAHEAIYRFNGESWQEISGHGSRVKETIQNNGLLLEAGKVKSDGTVLVTAGSDIYEITGEPDAWEMKKLLSTPCPTVQDMHFSEDGQLYIASLDHCIARQTADGWKTYELPPSSESPHPGYELGAREIVAQPGDRPPLVSTNAGIFAIEESGLRREFLGAVRDLVRVESKNAVFAVQHAGVIAKYY